MHRLRKIWHVYAWHFTQLFLDFFEVLLAFFTPFEWSLLSCFKNWQHEGSQIWHQIIIIVDGSCKRSCRPMISWMWQFLDLFDFLWVWADSAFFEVHVETEEPTTVVDEQSRLSCIRFPPSLDERSKRPLQISFVILYRITDYEQVIDIYLTAVRETFFLHRSVDSFSHNTLCH